MKKHFTIILAFILMLMLTSGCGSSAPKKENAAFASEKLTEKFISIGYAEENMQTEDGRCMEWQTEEMKEVEIDGTECFAMELRYSEDESINGEMAARLVGIYAVSKDGTAFYQYNMADDTWGKLE